MIVTRSFSKSYALAGLRFGFAVAQPQVIEELQKVKDSYNCDTLSIAAATAVAAVSALTLSLAMRHRWMTRCELRA